MSHKVLCTDWNVNIRSGGMYRTLAPEVNKKTRVVSLGRDCKCNLVCVSCVGIGGWMFIPSVSEAVQLNRLC